MRKIASIILCLLIGGYGIGLSASAGPRPHLEAKAFPGMGSILIVWETPENTAVETITIYRSESLNDEFIPLVTLPENTDRFLDSTAFEQQRYFYYIEMISPSGEVYTTSQETPAFARIAPQRVATEIDSGKTVYRPSSLDAYFAHNLSRARHRISPIYADLFTLVNQDSMTMDLLSEALPPMRILSVDPDLATTQFDTLMIGLHSEFSAGKDVVRNSLLLTPDEYDTAIDAFLARIKTRGQQLITVLKHYQEYLVTLPQVRFKKLEKTPEDSLIATFQIITFRDRTFEITYEDEALTVTVPDSLEASGEFAAPLPASWSVVGIRYQDTVLDQKPVPASGSAYTISVWGDIVPAGLEQDRTSSLMLNEIRYTVPEQVLELEIFIPANTSESFALMVGDSVYWQDVVMTGFEPEFLDSAFTLTWNDSASSGWVTLWKTSPDSSRFSDAFIFNRLSSLQFMREPDGRLWKQSTQASFGASNRRQDDRIYHLAVPEVFALYQNYPNPFNSGTTIAFDLLQPATVTLYVTNAAGRVIETFLLQTPMTVGHYTYQWFGHQHASGLYFYTITAEVENYLPITYSRKMIYLK